MCRVHVRGKQAAIAVKHRQTGQVKSFSIHMIAEIKNIPPNEITDDKYKEIEKNVR